MCQMGACFLKRLSSSAVALNMRLKNLSEPKRNFKMLSGNSGDRLLFYTFVLYLKDTVFFSNMSREKVVQDSL